jgi:hypothetical protein
MVDNELLLNRLCFIYTQLAVIRPDNLFIFIFKDSLAGLDFEKYKDAGQLLSIMTNPSYFKRQLLEIC